MSAADKCREYDGERGGASICSKRLRRLIEVLAGGIGFFFAALILTPLPSALLEAPVQSVEFFDRRGVSLRRVLVEQSRYSQRCSPEDLSPHVIAATLSAEDKRFWIHPGVDPLAMLRALGAGIGGGGIRSGASTVTQQLVKVAAQEENRTLVSKVREVWMALRVETAWSKRRILSEYLNRLDYGNLQTGITAASRHYFSKLPVDLSPAESAFLAALPKAPSRLNPRRHMEAARARQLWVLDRMLANGWLSTEAWKRAREEPLHVAALDLEFRSPLFVNRLLMRRGLLPPGGGAVHTTLDLSIDQRVQNFLSDNLASLRVPGVAGAVVVLENATGNILSMAGAHADSSPGADRMDGAWAVRSPGSAMKPFTYALALEKGMHPGSVVGDVPSTFATSTGVYRPHNYNLHFHGPVSLRFALGNSLNVPAVRVLESVGGPAALHGLMIRLGVTSFRHGPEYYGLGLTLGNGEVRLLEMVNAYAALARLGEYRPYHLVTRGSPVQTVPERVLSPETCYLLADMMSDNSARAEAFGLDSQLRFDFPVACKTGTSSDYRDNWTLGFTPEFTVGVWVGRPDGSPMPGVSGVAGAAPIFHAVMESLHGTEGTSWYARPESIRQCLIDPLTGRGAPPECRRGIWEKCASAPEPFQPTDYDAVGRVWLSGEYRQWFESPRNSLGAAAILGERSGALEVVEPAAGAVFFLDGDLPPDSQTVALQAVGAGQADLKWECATAPVVFRGGLPRLELRAGVHEVRVYDRRSGQHASTRVEVRPL